MNCCCQLGQRRLGGRRRSSGLKPGQREQTCWRPRRMAWHQRWRHSSIRWRLWHYSFRDTGQLDQEVSQCNSLQLDLLLASHRLSPRVLFEVSPKVVVVEVVARARVQVEVSSLAEGLGGPVASASFVGKMVITSLCAHSHATQSLCSNGCFQPYKELRATVDRETTIGLWWYSGTHRGYNTESQNKLC